MEKDNNNEHLILETAERLFLEKGFAMTSTTEIAKEVGCNQAMVHYYYRTKEKLFEAIFEKKIKKFMSPFLQDFNADIPFEDRLKQLIEGHFDIINENPKIPFLFFNELLTNPARLESLKSKISELPQAILFKIGNDLQAEIEKGNIRTMNPLDLLISIVSLNVTIFLMAPILKNIANLSDTEFKKIIANRKKESVLIILRSLEP
ncbi:TetR/AcrR family transcriptional regulator [uncultured Draconibacterium sp.]|uniref:TetR/AcrR family transcriptional regulator n=1 Tax=uncultured Draconibacterium sp. TaxID=1573823 RepID=UPI00321697C9